MHARRSCLQEYENGHSPHRRALFLRVARWSAGTAAFVAATVVSAAVVVAAAVVAVVAQLQPSLVVGVGLQSSRCPTLLRGLGDEVLPRCPAVVAPSPSGTPATVVLGWRVLEDPPSISRGVSRTAAPLWRWGVRGHCTAAVGWAAGNELLWMLEVSVTATGARTKEDGETAGDVRGMPQFVVVVGAVVSVAATGEPVECTEMRGVTPSCASA